MTAPEFLLAVEDQPSYRIASKPFRTIPTEAPKPGSTGVAAVETCLALAPTSRPRFQQILSLTKTRVAALSLEKRRQLTTNKEDLCNASFYED